jgi:hypothetical protein
LISCSLQVELKEQITEKSVEVEPEDTKFIQTEESESSMESTEEAEAEAESSQEAEAESTEEAEAESTEEAEAESTEESEEEMAKSQLGTSELSSFIEEAASTGADFPENYFDGNWLMYGYGCNRNTPKVEKCKCHTEGNEFICIKTLGDDCVTTGNETFRGKTHNPHKSGKNYSITYVVGNARRPNSGHWRNRLHIINNNEYRSQGRKYIRDTAQNEKEKPKPAPVPVEPKPVPRPLITPIPRPLITPAPRPLITPAPRPVISTKPLFISPPRQPMVYYYTNYFLGNWNGIGYVCDKETPAIEVVNIRYHKGRLYAVKLLGDNCVPRGKLSFEAPIPGKLWQGLKFGCLFVVGSPQHPAARQVNNNITIIDINTFKIGERTFYRSMGPGSAHPHGVYLNMTPLVGHSAYPGPGYVKLNPKKNMRSPVRRFVIVEEETNKPGNC